MMAKESYGKGSRFRQKSRGTRPHRYIVDWNRGKIRRRTGIRRLTDTASTASLESFRHQQINWHMQTFKRWHWARHQKKNKPLINKSKLETSRPIITKQGMALAIEPANNPTICWIGLDGIDASWAMDGKEHSATTNTFSLSFWKKTKQKASPALLAIHVRHNQLEKLHRSFFLLPVLSGWLGVEPIHPTENGWPRKKALWHTKQELVCR